MGNELIDLDRVDENVRCQSVKRAIIWINLIVPPISIILLLIVIIRMIIKRKNKTFITKLIILIFISEVLQSCSKVLQPIKYGFDDERNNKTITDFDRPRSLICQFQIVFAISSDFCSLISTLLLTLKCYYLIKRNKRSSNSGKKELFFIILDISLSIILGISFLFIDRSIVYVSGSENISYRYDVRDRCSYWCWLEHYSSLACLGLYVIILLVIIIFAFKTYFFLNQGYKKMLKETDFERSGLGVKSFSSYSSENDENNLEIKETKEEFKKIRNLNLTKKKSFIYPLVTIIYWIFAATYRIVDDIWMMDFDYGEDPDSLSRDEQMYFEQHPEFQTAVQFFLVAFTFFSAIRGILYGFSFIIFEESVFCGFFKNFCERCCCCCLEGIELGIDDDDESENNNIKERNTEMSENDLMIEE